VLRAALAALLLAAAPAAAGRILVLATATPVHGPRVAVEIRLLADGIPDPGFGTGGIVTLTRGVTAHALLVDRSGAAWALGAIPGRGARPVHAVVYRLDARGRIRRAHHLALHGRHSSGDVEPTSLARGRRGALILAGNDSGGSRTWGWVARLRRDGRWDHRSVLAGRRRDFHIVPIREDLGRSYFAAVRLKGGP
jgi:hypothetical protein